MRKYFSSKERSFHFPQINRIPRLLRQLIRLYFPSPHLVLRTVFFASSVSHIPSIRTPIPRLIASSAPELPFLNSKRLDRRVNPWNHPRSWIAPFARSRGLFESLGKVEFWHFALALGRTADDIAEKGRKKRERVSRSENDPSFTAYEKLNLSLRCDRIKQAGAQIW